MATPLRFSPVSTDDHAAGYARVLSHCYARPPSDTVKWLTRHPRDAQFVLTDFRARGPESVLAGLITIPMAHSFGGRFVEGAGIAGVGVAPEHRGRSAATTLMNRAVQHLHAQGLPLSGLYPATQALYRRSGYEQAGHRCLFRTPLPKVDCRERTARVRPATPKDTPEIQRLYESVATVSDGMLQRRELLWRRATLIPPMRDEPAHCFVVEGPRRGTLEGYVYLHQPPGPEGKPEVHVLDMTAVTARAGLRLWSFLASYSTICTDLAWSCTPAHPMLTLLPEQSFKLSLHMYWMLRIIDVKAALEARGYPAGLRATFAIEVTDPLLRPNNGTYILDIADRRAGVTRNPRRPFKGPRISLAIDALAPLYSGFLPAAHLRMLGRITGDDKAIALASSAFSGQTPGMCEMF